MKKKITIVLLFAFLIGLTFGISMIQDIQTDFARYMIVLYLVFLVGNIVYVNMNFMRTGLLIYLYPLIVIVLYLPANILAGVYFSEVGGFSYYGSFPRYRVTLFYGLFLLFLYLIARGIDASMKSRHTKIVYIVTDTLSLSALPFLLFWTYFVSPA
ncbi:MAG: hypothetical protein K9L64_07135 [Candidatus Izimaplasma sp.]|nr:hypothetical protein [Candidatus Izimaplasma bacterium]